MFKKLLKKFSEIFVLGPLHCNNVCSKSKCRRSPECNKMTKLSMTVNCLIFRNLCYFEKYLVVFSIYLAFFFCTSTPALKHCNKRYVTLPFIIKINLSNCAGSSNDSNDNKQFQTKISIYYITVQCSAVQNNTVQRSIVQCIALQCSVVQSRAVQNNTMQCSTV